MAKILIEPLPPPPVEYDQQQMATLIRTLQLALQQVNYTKEPDSISRVAMHWIGL